jgi:uncharacterized protein YcbX
MTVVGKVESLWRYPVKSMRGEKITQSYLGFSGAYGDRLYAFYDKSAPEGFPFLTAREQEQMLLYQPRFRLPGACGEPSESGSSRSRRARSDAGLCQHRRSGRGHRDAFRRGGSN